VLATVLARGDWFWDGRLAWRMPVLLGFALVAAYEAWRGLGYLRKARALHAAAGHANAAASKGGLP